MKGPREYVAQAYGGRFTLFWATGRQAGGPDRRLGWKAVAEGGVEVHRITGDHLSMMREPLIQGLAQELKACLEASWLASPPVPIP